jgi:signal transduction histidine kinase
VRVPAGVAHAARVAFATTLLVGIVYAACAAVLDHVVFDRLITSAKARLSDRLADAREIGIRASGTDDDDLDSTPVYLWRLTKAGLTPEPGSPRLALPAGFTLAQGKAAAVRLRQGTFLMLATTAGGRTLVGGESLIAVQRLNTLLFEGEALAAPAVLLAVFAAALIIGLRALSPVEQSRRRQLEFTADASHELRTPLSVISAETSIALSVPRKAAEYRATLHRIDRENERLAKIVEDLLWLARFDAAPPQPTEEPLDLTTIAAMCADRFRALAEDRQFRLEVVTGPGAAAWISAPSEWIDRLAGVLADNACRHAGPDGVVRVSTGQRGSRVTLTVEDSGPGIAPEHRARLFDRFYRSTRQGGTAGLGLAIADSIVRSTGGQWRLCDSDLGGALFEVSWRRANLRQHGSAASGSRQFDPDHGAAARTVGDRDGSAVRLRDGLDDGQPEPGAGIPIPPGAGTAEALEGGGQVLGREAGAGVGNFDGDTGSSRLGTDLDLSAIGGEPERVVDEVVDSAPDLISVDLRDQAGRDVEDAGHPG